LRTVNIGAGLLANLLALAIFLSPRLGVNILIGLLAFDLIIQGLIRVTNDWSYTALPNWLRGILILTGLLSLLFSGIVLVFQDVVVFTLTYLLALALLINGIARLIIGITGIEIVDE